MKVWIMILVLHNIVPFANGPKQPETDVYIGAFSASEICEQTLRVYKASIPEPASSGMEVHCVLQTLDKEAK
jgi:hypothetical protein